MICTMDRSASDPGDRTVVLQSCHVWHESTWIRGKKAEGDMNCSGIDDFSILPFCAPLRSSVSLLHRGKS